MALGRVHRCIGKKNGLRGLEAAFITRNDRRMGTNVSFYNISFIMTSVMTPIAVCHFLKSKMKIIPRKHLKSCLTSEMTSGIGKVSGAGLLHVSFLQAGAMSH